jgi:alkaline phosphatase D
VVLTGDLHSSWALDLAPQPFDLLQYDPRTGRGSLGVELVCPAVSAPGVRNRDEAQARAIQTLASHPHVRWADLWHRGYVTLDVDEERVQADWWHVPSVSKRSLEESFARGFVTRSGSAHLVAAPGPAPSRSKPPPLAR